jgi:hypothetical protein
LIGSERMWNGGKDEEGEVSNERMRFNTACSALHGGSIGGFLITPACF